jgi:prolyl-tRNA synthetase
MGQRSFNKIMGIVREEMDKIGQEFYLPAIHPRELWEASGRWAVMGDTMFRLKDRKGADLCLSMTHEEVMTEIARKELRSYKQLPQIWYQIQSKFRDEARPKSGLLRVRQFIMKDSYSFDIDAAGLDVSYQKHYDLPPYLRPLRTELHGGRGRTRPWAALQSHEFMVRTPAGRRPIVSCENCKYAANLTRRPRTWRSRTKPRATASRSSAHAGHEDHRGCRQVPGRFGQEQDEDAGADDGVLDPKTGKTLLRARCIADARRPSDE